MTPQAACADIESKSVHTTLLAFAAERRRLLYLPPAERSAANPPHGAAGVDR